VDVTQEMRTSVLLIDGPEAGNVIFGYPGEPPDEIVVFRTQIVDAGTLVCVPDADSYLPGDLLYQKVSRSDLFDRPGFKGHPNLTPGCGYLFVRELDSTVPAASQGQEV
jgi:hypothetical protein